MYPNLNVTHFAGGPGGIKIWGFLPIQWAMLAEVQLVAWPLPARAAPSQWWMAGPRKFLFKSNWKQHKSFFSDLFHPSSLLINAENSEHICERITNKWRLIMSSVFFRGYIYLLECIKSINWTNRVRALNQFLFCLPNPFNVSSREDLSVVD